MAWIRFVNGEETYAGVPYFWQGRVNVELQIRVAPGPGHVLELLWGSKDDDREAIATINGRDVRITGGGYDGFQWLSVPVPPRVSGDRYEVTLRKGLAKPAFIAEIRLTEKRTGDSGPTPDLRPPASKIILKTTPPAPPEAFPEMRSFWDQPGSADEYADSIEGAINLYNRERVESAAEWMDSEIQDMWRVQRADLRFGSVERGGKLYVSLLAEQPWSGKLAFDKQRHKVQMRLPLDYPRINQFPEWFVAQPARRYTVRDLNAGSESSFSGQQLQAGVAVELEPGKELRLIVTAADD